MRAAVHDGYPQALPNKQHYLKFDMLQRALH